MKSESNGAAHNATIVVSQKTADRPDKQSEEKQERKKEKH